MARELKILCVLWLVSACLATVSGGQSTSPPTQTASTGTPEETTTSPPTQTASTGTPEETTTSPPTQTASTGTPEETATSPPTQTASTKTPEETATSPPTQTASTESPAETATSPPTQTASTESPAETATSPPTQTASTESQGGETTGPHTQPPPTETPGAGPCDPNPCGIGSTCAPRHNETFVCLCLAGDFYNDERKICEKAKVFPGQLTLPSIPYDENMADKKSQIFLDTSNKITEALSDAFKDNDGYSGSIVLDIRPINKAKVWLRNNNGVNTTVEIIFAPSAGIKTKEVLNNIKKAADCPDCALKGSTFKEENLCDKEPCDKKSTKCESGNGTFTCYCMDNYIKTNFSDRICIACSSGSKPDGSSKCVACPFGYSGFNCNESWQLTLVIVGSVLGGLLLITLILLPIVALKSSKKSSKKKNKNGDIGTYVTHSPAKAPLVNGNHTASFNGQANSFANAGVPKIPRATTTSSWDNRTNLEMTPSNSRQNLVNSGRNMRQFEDDDDMPPYAQSRPQSSLYAQARPQSSLYAQARPQNNPYAQDRPQNNPYAQDRPQNNPYAQDRPQNNPYASSQGHANPYYMHDNGRRFD